MPSTKCAICAKEFYVKPYLLGRGWGIFCSKVCQFKGQHKGKVFKCSYCDKDVYRLPRDIKKTPSGNFFCDKSCFAKFKNKLWSFGEEHFNWRGGESVYRELMLRNDKKAHECERCHIDDLRVLVVHHIDHNRKNNVLSNLKWLCRNCHYIEHNGKTY